MSTFDDGLARLLEEESREPESWWWLSYATEGAFLGVALVEACGFVTAVRLAKEMGISPGGEVRGFRMPVEVPAEWTNRLLTRLETAEVDDWIEAQTDQGST